MIFVALVAAACGANDDANDQSGAGVSADLATDVSPGDEIQTASPGTVRVESSPTNSTTAATSTTVAQTSSTQTSSTETATAQTSTTATETTTTTLDAGTTVVGAGWGSPETVRLRFESQISDVPVAEFQAAAMAILTDPRGWGQAGFTFVADPDGPYRVVLAEGAAVDQLCLPLNTFGTVSCQNGPVVAINADRWRTAVDHWVLGVEVYRGYLMNHEVGHLLGQRHPKPRCPLAGQPAGVMEQQTAGLEGCIGNPWPRDWELNYAGDRPVVYAPLPDWGPDPVPENREGK